MTEEQKLAVSRLSALGWTNQRIAAYLGVNTEAVRSQLRRRPAYILYKNCLKCGTVLEQIPKQKPKKFCCDACRLSYWAEQPAGERNLKKYALVCEYCGAQFSSVHQAQRFCSIKCSADSQKKKREKKNAETVLKARIESLVAESAVQSGPPERNADPGGEEIQSLPVHCQCSSCPWFIDGKRRCSDPAVSD